jgi:hypothetical protein
MHISIIHTKCFNALRGIQATTIYVTLHSPEKEATVYHSGRDVTIRDVVFRDIKTITVTGEVAFYWDRHQQSGRILQGSFHACTVYGR